MSYQPLVLENDINAILTSSDDLRDYFLDGISYTKDLFNKLNDASVFNDKIAKALKGIKNHQKIASIVVIGCGGTGSWLMPKLVKTINDAERKGILTNNFKFVMIDADTVEDKNLVRQNFVPMDIGVNKAEVMANRYGGLINPVYESIFFDKYISTKEQNLKRAPHERDMFIEVESLTELKDNASYGDRIIFNLVDNMKARVAVHTMATKNFFNTSGRTFVVDTGNDLYNGQFFVTEYYAQKAIEDKKQEKTSTSTICSSIESYFGRNSDQILSEEDVSLYSCAEADVDEENQDQMLVANDFAATICHNWLINFCLSKISSGNVRVQKEASFVCGSSSTMNTSEYHISPIEYAFGFVINTLFKSKAIYSRNGSILPFEADSFIADRLDFNIGSASIAKVFKMFKSTSYEHIVESLSESVIDKYGKVDFELYGNGGGNPFFMIHLLFAANLPKNFFIDTHLFSNLFILTEEAVKEGLIQH